MEIGKMSFMIGFVILMFFCHGLLLTMAYNVHNITYTLRETNFTRFCGTKSMLVVNDMFPGPTLEVRKGDKAFVNVTNNGRYGVTIHWHGVKQPRNPWSDGPENITQCPIQPGKSFTQEVIFSDQVGTLWWHAHSDWSRATVYGAIVIKPLENETYPFTTPDEEKVIMFGEWFTEDVKELIDNATRDGDDVPVSDSYTTNGWPGALSANCSETTYNFTVTQGKTYLLRVVNAAMNEDLWFGIANHSLLLVAQDANYIQPINTTYIFISPGQTMDVLFTANQTPSHYYFEASPFMDGRVTPPYDETNTVGILIYEGNYTAPTSPPLPNLPNTTDRDTANNFIKNLTSLSSSNDIPLNLTENILITIATNTIGFSETPPYNTVYNRSAASLNNITFGTPSNDSILGAYYKNSSNIFVPDFPDMPEDYNYTGINNTLYSLSRSGTPASVKVIKYGAAVQIVFQGTNIGNAENHPMHLHGYDFFLVGMADGNFQNETEAPEAYNFENPPLVNTITIPKNGWSAIRFYARNPGVWFFHCHFERHSSIGMSGVLIVENGSEANQSMIEPPAGMPICV